MERFVNWEQTHHWKPRRILTGRAERVTSFRNRIPETKFGEIGYAKQNKQNTLILTSNTFGASSFWGWFSFVCPTLLGSPESRGMVSWSGQRARNLNPGSEFHRNWLERLSRDPPLSCWLRTRTLSLAQASVFCTKSLAKVKRTRKRVGAMKRDFEIGKNLEMDRQAE